MLSRDRTGKLGGVKRDEPILSPLIYSDILGERYVNYFHRDAPGIRRRPLPCKGDYDLGMWGYAYNIDDPDDVVNAVYGPGARNYTRWKHPKFLEMLAQQSEEVDREKRRQILRQMQTLLLTEEDPYIQILWKSWTYLVSDKVRTEAGPFVTPPSLQTIHKNEHLRLET